MDKGRGWRGRGRRMEEDEGGGGIKRRRMRATRRIRRRRKKTMDMPTEGRTDARKDGRPRDKAGTIDDWNCVCLSHMRFSWRHAIDP